MTRKSLRLTFISFVSFVPLVSVFSGCGGSPFQPDPIVLNAPAYTNYSHTLEWELAIENKDVLPSPGPNPGPNPNPTPKIGDTCPVCEGRGKSGDGINPCNPCKGDGKVDGGDPILISEAIPTTENKGKESLPAEEPKVKEELHQVNLVEFGDLIKSLEPAIKNLSSKLEEVRIPEEKVDPNKLIPAPVEDRPLPPILPQKPNERLFTEVTQYHMKWNMRFYTWSDDLNCFIDTLGHRVTFNSILGFHPSKYQNVQMGCTTGQCTLVPITRSTARVEIKPNEFGTPQRSTANGGSKN